ncbi:MAG: ABC transporter substrate-binding protein [Acetobacteraceae bacterium]|nr:ABC transporter substrate-binding protein [Acetobacteraceae bacterium]
MARLATHLVPMLAAAGLAMAGLALSTPAQAQTLRLMQYIDAPHFDAQRTTWGPGGSIANMTQSTLVAMDWDGKTVHPYLAKSWEISPDGRTYTFHLRDDVTFCSGKKFTADDVVYTFQRLKAPETKAPFGWRAGEIKSLRALDAHTVAYELAEPYSDLLLQLTMFTNNIINKDVVEELGKDYGVKGTDGTGPWCFVSWQPRTETILRRNEAYKWGPAMFKNPGPVKFERLSIRIMPEESARVAAMMSGQFDFTASFPAAFIPQARANPNLNVEKITSNFQLLYYGYKITRPMVADPRVREAMNIAINRAQIVKGVLLGNADVSTTYTSPLSLDFNPKTEGLIREDVERAKKLLDEAGWKPGADGIREKDGIRLEPKVYVTGGGNSVKVGEAIQGFLRRVGIDWRLQVWDSTIAPVKMAEQDYEIWSVTVPYISAGDLMSLYFDSRNIPSPNRMNWKDAQTDHWLAEAKAALTPQVKALNYGLVQERVTRANLWMPVANITLYTVSNKRIKNVRGHPQYAIGFYKGLDFTP